jgi:hypothetical protein
MDDHAYIVRFGPTRRDIALVPMSLVFVVVGVAFAADNPLLGIATVALGGLYLALWIAVVLTRRIALAVTDAGITLAMAPPWSRRTGSARWSDIEAIILWRQQAGRATMRYIGVQLRPGAPPLAGSARNSTLRRLNRSFSGTSLSEAVVNDSRPMSFWRIDKDRLAAAVARYAPHVRLIDNR